MKNFRPVIPGSKSILQRLLVLLAHAKGDIRVRNYNPCNDVLELQEALSIFGYQIETKDAALCFTFSPELHAESHHCYHFEASATAYRLWLSVLANLPGVASQVEASETLFNRGIQPLCDTLNELGAACRIEGRKVLIEGTILRGGEAYSEARLSSQYASSLLLAAPFMNEALCLKLSSEIVSRPYLTLSAEMLHSFGAEVEFSTDVIRAAPAQFTLPSVFTLDSDLSTAAFYAVKAALGNEVVELELTLHADYHQADYEIWNMLRKMGAFLELKGNVYRVYPSELHGVELNLKDNPDLMPLLCVAALFAGGTTCLKGIGRLVHKESNRVSGICKALDLLGAKYLLEADAIRIWPYPGEPPELNLDTQQDHRLVMAFSLLNERFPQVRLSEWESLHKSVPMA